MCYTSRGSLPVKSQDSTGNEKKNAALTKKNKTKKKQPTVNFKNNIPTKGVYFFKNYSYIQFNSIQP